MVDIYDEEGYIKYTLSGGISEKWERDAKILIRFLKDEKDSKTGTPIYTKRQVRDKVEEKLILASKRSVNPIAYMNKSTDQDRFYKFFEKTWKKGEPLRKIRKIEMAREVVDWFIDLTESFELEEDTLKQLKKEYDDIGINVSLKKKIINWNRIKFLFTLYIWTRIQENYLELPYMHYLNNYKKRFKQDANLSMSFKMEDEMTVLQDIGMIGISPKTSGVKAKFIEDYDVFKTEITEENRVIIESYDVGMGDLYFPGYWLEKYKMGSFVCQHCGNEFAHYGKSKGEMGRKYCRECAKIVRDGEKKLDDKVLSSGVIKRTCEECGKTFSVKDGNTRSKRCPNCQKIRTRAIKTNWDRAHADKSEFIT